MFVIISGLLAAHVCAECGECHYDEENDEQEKNVVLLSETEEAKVE